MSTVEVTNVSCIQCSADSGSTLNILPPIFTISTCPTTINSPTPINPAQRHIDAKADVFVANALALNIFQNCNITNMVKKSDNS